MKAADAAKLIRDYRECCVGLAELANAQDDGGSCNYDVCLIHTVRRSKPLEREIGARRVRHFAGRGYLLHVPGVMGQGARMTFAAEELARRLRARGHDASVWYQAD